MTLTIRSNTISPQERARKAGKIFDYFSVSIYETQSELLVHTRVNHANTVRFAREARVLLRKGDRHAHRIHELACEDKAHAHSIIARANSLSAITPEGIAARAEILRICKRTLAVNLR
jgi:hypothetical protein